MAKCKRCGSRLSDEASVCPVCGLTNPLNVDRNKTDYDLTMAFDPMEQNSKLYTLKSRKRSLILAWLLGFTGAPFFYMQHRKHAFIILATSLLSALALFLILFLLFDHALVTLCAIPGVWLIINIIIGAYLGMHPSLKDGNGEYLR